jgi:Spy/CpxP family protein refolding chaperone
MRKRICVLVFVAVFAVGLAWAGQYGQKPSTASDAAKPKTEMDIASHVAKLKTELNLTDEQADKVKAVLEDTHKRKMALRSETADQQKSESKKLMAEQDTRLKEILTPEQLTKYQQLKAQHAKEQTEHKNPQ